MPRPKLRKPRRLIAQVLAELATPKSQRPRATPTLEQQAEIAARFAHLQASQPLQGLRAALRLGGITTAVVCGYRGSSAFGWSLHGHRGGNAIRSHRYRRGSDGRWLPSKHDSPDSSSPDSTS